MSFAHLHVHSIYSLLDGYCSLKKLIARAKEMGMPAIGLTDHGTMFGAIEFYSEAVKAGIKPLIGVETYVAARTMADRDPTLDKDRFHLVLLAINAAGYKNLLQIASASQLDGFYYKPRIDHAFLRDHAEGLIATTSCLAGEVPQALLRGDYEGARRKFDFYYETFGPENFYVELQDHAIPELPEVNRGLIELNKRYNVRYVATNDVHYVDPDDFRLQDILLAIQTGCVLTDPKRMRMTDASYHLRSPQEMQALFGEYPGALTNTLEIADRSDLDLGFKGYRLPIFPVPDGETAESYLRRLCEQGARLRYGDAAGSETVQQRLDYELSVIHQMGFDAYFLIVWDLCHEAAQRGIWYTARGSAAGSIVAYCLRITTVDPFSNGLIFERFLNPGRISMPDIDLDFPDDRRAEMMAYCADKYGQDKVAQIITFGTLKARAAVRDVGRVMDIPLEEVDRVAKLIPNIPGKPVTIEEAIAQVPDLAKVYKEDARMREVLDTARHMEGVVRNAGTHAAGVVITDRPIVEYAPLHRPTSNSEDLPIKTVTQFEMNIVDKMGLLKVDFLGLTTLTVMARACELIEQRHGVRYTLDNIPVDDPKAFEMMGRGDTAGMFQVEGSGMTRFIMQMKPHTLENVIAMIALFRPGPMDFIPSYIHRMHGEEKVTYIHPALKPIFEETYGIAIYQEQIMRAAAELAGYTNSEADDLRKAIAKKIPEKLLEHQEKFVSGAEGRGTMPREAADAIFNNWLEFARYGFNKCLPGEVEVLDAETGRLVTVASLYERYQNRQNARFSTLSCDIDSLKLQTNAVSSVMNNGIKPVYRLQTQSGRTIEATANHPFFTMEGWRVLDEIQAGDFIATPRKISVEGKQVWPDFQVITLGHLIAEGNLCHPHSVYFYSQDQEQVSDYIAAAEQFDNVDCSISVHKDTFSVYARRIDRTEPPGIVEWVQSLGLWGKKATEKEIPAQAFELGNRQIGLLLSRMWEGDGHINYADRSLFYATSSERLAHQVQHLLLRLGILSRIHTIVFPYKGGRTGYQIRVTGNENFARFHDVIAKHLVNTRKAAEVYQLILENPSTFSTKDIVPLGVKTLVRKAKANAEVTWTQILQETGVAQREFYPTNAPMKRGYHRQTISRLASYFSNRELQRYADSDIFWDEVVSIEYVGEKQTFDLEVPGTHNFIANDILVHNSHAAVYGVIAVQTAFLKAHHPIEYMTATLSAYKSDTDRVALYVADCRRMGIEVLPPDINTSGWDFSIEDRPDGSARIRFGLGAVKNVGHGPAEAIMAAIQTGGPFTNLSDLTRRLDLRMVGKRALESLVKVGALDGLGPRAALLEILDRILAISASHFRAADAGQMTLFGEQTGLVTKIELPDLPQDHIDRRAILNWERELIGLYVSDHPLSPYMDSIRRVTSHLSGELTGLPSQTQVRVAGLVTKLRRHLTKSGKPMAFVTLEDIQGPIELLVFPRTWAEHAALFEPEQVILVEGKLDAEGAEPKVLVDSVTTEWTLIDPLTAPAPRPLLRRADVLPPADPDDGLELGDEEFEADAAVYFEPAVLESAPQSAPMAAPAAAAASSVPQKSGAGMPPPPEDPPDWHMFDMFPLNVDEMDEPIVGKEMKPRKPAPTPAPEPVPASAAPDPEPPTTVADPVPAAPPAGSAAPAAESPRVAEPRPPLILPPHRPLEKPADEHPAQMLTITLKANGDRMRDQLRIQRIFGMLISHPGADHFAFYVFEGSKSYLVEFPNYTTHIDEELLASLREISGIEGLQVEPIIYQ